jgi:hypothetical protein
MFNSNENEVSIYLAPFLYCRKQAFVWEKTHNMLQNVYYASNNSILLKYMWLEISLKYLLQTTFNFPLPLKNVVFNMEYQEKKILYRQSATQCHSVRMTVLFLQVGTKYRRHILFAS